MPTFADLNMAPPNSADEFEDITCSAAKNRWEQPDFTKHGRRGQSQKGVDVYGTDNNGDSVGIQCKNTTGGVKLATVKAEVKEAEAFEPKLKRLYIATTANTDEGLQEEVRKLSENRVANGDFEVAVLFWKDIWLDLTRDESRLFQHYPQLLPKSESPSHDLTLFRQLQSELPYSPTVKLLAEQDFGGSFSKTAIQPLYDFYETWSQPDKEFLDAELQEALTGLYAAVKTMSTHLVQKTVPVGTGSHFVSVYSDNQRAMGPRPPKVLEDAKILNEEATKFVPIYSDFIRLCKRKLEK